MKVGGLFINLESERDSVSPENVPRYAGFCLAATEERITPPGGVWRIDEIVEDRVYVSCHMSGAALICTPDEIRRDFAPIGSVASWEFLRLSKITHKTDPDLHYKANGWFRVIRQAEVKLGPDMYRSLVIEDRFPNLERAIELVVGKEGV